MSLFPILITPFQPLFFLYKDRLFKRSTNSNLTYLVCVCVCVLCCVCIYMEKNDQGSGCYCYFHPDEVFVGVCPLCLYERLIVVAAKRCRGGLRLYASSACKSSKPCMVVPKMFAIDYLIHRKTKKNKLKPKAKDVDDDDASASLDDSFISIRFDEDNTVGAWEKGKDPKSIVEHAKPQWSSLRWRKRIGHVFQLITSKKSNKLIGSTGRMVKGSRWIRNLTRRKKTGV
ncbi:putative protein OCTOPUS [Helianthus annuus]|nr:putative protein OCTOPUS [Helianthus annuus]KAJ0930603.1 putative protein OCTOPUS [Helianthus annuus]